MPESVYELERTINKYSFYYFLDFAYPTCAELKKLAKTRKSATSKPALPGTIIGWIRKLLVATSTKVPHNRFD